MQQDSGPAERGYMLTYILTGAKLVDEYAKMLSSAHGENCPWRNKSCDGESE